MLDPVVGGGEEIEMDLVAPARRLGPSAAPVQPPPPPPRPLPPSQPSGLPVGVPEAVPAVVPATPLQPGAGAGGGKEAASAGSLPVKKEEAEVALTPPPLPQAAPVPPPPGTLAAVSAQPLIKREERGWPWLLGGWPWQPWLACASSSASGWTLPLSLFPPFPPVVPGWEGPRGGDSKHAQPTAPPLEGAPGGRAFYPEGREGTSQRGSGIPPSQAS